MELETNSDWETESDEDLSFADVIQPFVKQVLAQSKTSSKDQQNIVKELVLHEIYVPNLERLLENEEEQEIIETMPFQDVKEITYDKKDRQQSADITIRLRKTLVKSLHCDFLETTEDGNSVQMKVRAKNLPHSCTSISLTLTLSGLKIQNHQKSISFQTVEAMI